MSSVGSNISIGVSANITDLKAKMAGARKEVQGLGEAVRNVGGHGGGGLAGAMKFLKPTFKELGMGQAGIFGHALHGIGAGGMLGGLGAVAGAVGAYHIVSGGISESGREAREGIAASHKLGVSYGDYERISKAAGDDKEVLAGLAIELRNLAYVGKDAAASVERFRNSLPAGASGGLGKAQIKSDAGGFIDKYGSLQGAAKGLFNLGVNIGTQNLDTYFPGLRRQHDFLAERRDQAERRQEAAARIGAQSDSFLTPGDALKKRLEEIAEARRGGLDSTMAARAAVLAGGQYGSAMQSAAMPGAMTEGSAAAYSAVAGYQGRQQDAQYGQEKMIELLGSIDQSLVNLATQERNFQHQPAIP
jgi:hypothetical protein